MLGCNGCWIGVTARNLCGSAADEEPLVYRAVDLRGGELLVLGDLAELVGADARGGLRDGQVGAAFESVHRVHPKRQEQKS